MRNWTIKGLKRCPSCKSTNIYKRSRTIKIEKKKGRKTNHNFIEERVKPYRCHKCKCEFGAPIVE